MDLKLSRCLNVGNAKRVVQLITMHSNQNMRSECSIWWNFRLGERGNTIQLNNWVGWHSNHSRAKLHVKNSSLITMLNSEQRKFSLCTKLEMRKKILLSAPLPKSDSSGKLKKFVRTEIQWDFPWKMASSKAWKWFWIAL